MVESEAGKIEWSIKKADFLSGKFDDATLDVGVYTWSLSSDSKNPLRGGTVFLTLSCIRKNKSPCTLYSCWQSHGNLCLKGLGGRQSAMKPWHWDESDVQLKVDTSVFSFDEKYLFPDGTYHIEFNVEQDSSAVDFASPDHALILGLRDVGCLQIEGKRVYVSKSYFSAQSTYFKALVFSDFRKKDQEVIVLNDVKFNTFTEFLAHLYVEFRSRIDEAAIPDVLALADMWLCNTVTRSCEFMLVGKRSFTIADLELADKYRLQKLRVKAVAGLPISELKTYMAQVLHNRESMYTRLFIMERIEKETLT